MDQRNIKGTFFSLDPGTVLGTFFFARAVRKTKKKLSKQTYTLACMLSFSHGVLPRVNGNLNARMNACIINAVITRPRAPRPDDKLRRARSVVTCLCIAVVD